MSLFGASQEIIVETTATRVIEDKMLPDAIKTGGMISLMSGSDLVETVRDQLFGGFPSNVEAMYRYGRDRYEHGLPSGQFVSSGQGSPEVRQVLADIHNVSLGDISIMYHYIQASNYFHFAWMKLIEVYGYNPVTNELPVLSASIGVPVFLDDMILQMPAGSVNEYSHQSLVQWDQPANAGPSPARRFTSNLFRLRLPARAVPGDINSIQFLVSYSWNVPYDSVNPFTINGYSINRGSDVIVLDNFNEKSTYLHVKYSVGAEVKYVVYDPSTGVYPSLDNIIFPPPVAHGEFFPFTYFRFNNIPESDDKTSQSYITNKAMVSKLNLDYDTIEESVNEAENIEFVEQAMMILAIRADSTEEIERRYLYDFFSKIPEFHLKTRNDLFNSGGEYVYSLVIQDKRFKFALEALELKRHRVIGSIGPVGTHDLVMSTRPVDQSISFIFTPDKEVHTYRRQVTTYFYEEIVILDLQMHYFIYGEYTRLSDGDASIRMIPLDRSIIGAYGLSDREELYSRSLHYIFNTKQVIKIPWWQTGFFKFLFIVITIVLIVVSIIALQGQLTAVFVGALISGATAAGAAVAVAIAIVEIVAIGIALGYAFRKLVKLIGLEGSFIAALVLMVVHVVAPSGTTLSLGSSVTSVSGAPFAQSFLQLSTGLITAIGSVIKEKIGGLAEEFEELNLLKEEAAEDFARANELLERSNNLISPFVVFGESPDEYYNRTIHSGNIGILSVDAVSEFVDISLRLPELKDLTGGIY